MHDVYKTIGKEGISVFKDRGSKFLGFAFYVQSENEIKEKLDKLRKEYHDARHHCYAWKLGFQGEHWRANDDGEPSSSAGKPILQQIAARDLTNTLVVVIRYFGGVLLGVGGLINAYKNAASDALENSTIIEKLVEENIMITFPYEQTNEVMRVLNDCEGNIIHQEFTDTCFYRVSVRKSLSPRLLKALQSIPGIKAENTPS